MLAEAVLVSLRQRRMSSVSHVRASVHCIGVARRALEGHDTLGWPLSEVITTAANSAIGAAQLIITSERELLAVQRYFSNEFDSFSRYGPPDH